MKLIECPRDAMQGWPHFIPTASKIEYINSLLQVGFDTIDFGSFVSPKAIPQMADTKEVVRSLELGVGNTKLLAIIANTRGAEEASQYEQITYLGFPFSVSETFQQRNTNSSIEESFKRVEEIQAICLKQHKQLVVYLSMGFGNPYGDPYSEEIVHNRANKLAGLDIKILSLADTVGIATPEQVKNTTTALIKALPDIEVGVHLHSTPSNWKDKLEAAIQAGCIRFDGALKGIGGCPMAGDELVGNMNTELMIGYLKEPSINKEALEKSIFLADKIFL
jgi:hydroxymethylglutaryl-CoA lyase